MAFTLLRRGPTTRGGDAPVLAVAAQKGGVGKTTTAVHLAWMLAHERHRRVLLVDLDPQGHVGAHLSSHVRIETTRRLGDVLLDRRGDIMQVAVPVSAAPVSAAAAAGTAVGGGLHITCPDKSLHQVEVQLNARIGKELVVDRILARARSSFDVVVLDCPPNLGNLTVAALLASKVVLVPTDTSRLALEGVADILDTLEILRETFHRAPVLGGVLLTRVDRRSKSFNAQIRARLRGLVGGDLMDVEIPVQSAVARAQIAGTTLVEVDRSGAAAEAYRRLTGRVEELLWPRADGAMARRA